MKKSRKSRSYTARGRYHQRTARGNFGLVRKNALKKWKTRSYIKPQARKARTTFKKRYNPTRFATWRKKHS